MGKRSRSRSSSPHRSRKHKTSHSRERRRRSRSRGHEKHKSRSRDRKTERERRQSDGNGSERRRSSSRQNQSRSSDGHRRRQSRSKSRDKSREPARRNSSDSDKTKSLSSAEKAKSTEKGTPDISSFSEMTPAERVRAKLKVMLDKATASAVIPEENVVSATPPSEAQIRDIDSDVFTTESFVSTREKRKEQQVQSQSANQLITSFPRRSKGKVEDEYAPQVVELLENTDSGGIDHPMEQNVPAENAQPIAATTSVLETPAEEKKRKWLEKLQKLRQGLASAN